jgi:hypothetical protein
MRSRPFYHSPPTALANSSVGSCSTTSLAATHLEPKKRDKGHTGRYTCAVSPLTEIRLFDVVTFGDAAFKTAYRSDTDPPAAAARRARPSSDRRAEEIRRAHGECETEPKAQAQEAVIASRFLEVV